MVMGLVLGVVNGALVVWTRVPDIVVTLAMSFVWAGARCSSWHPGRRVGRGAWFVELASGSVVRGLAKAPGRCCSWSWRSIVAAAPSARDSACPSTPSAATASRPSGAASTWLGRVVAYALGGLFAACGGLALTMSTGIGTPTTGLYTLQGVTAIVLGGVSLAGGRGGSSGRSLAASSSG